MFAVTHEHATLSRFSRKTEDGRTVWRSQYFGPPPSPEGSSSLSPKSSSLEYVEPQPGEQRSPQAFLVEQQSGAVVHSHFHFVDQFQVVVAGSGLLGQHRVVPLGVHFAAACTGYGPIEPGSDGLSYFTFRACADSTGAQYLPASRSRMRPGRRRNVMLDPIAVGTETGAVQPGALCMETPISEPDGLAVSYFRLPPLAEGPGMDPGLGSGVAALVVDGSLDCGTGAFARWSCFFAGADESPMPLKASSQGAEVLMMRFPVTSLG